MAEGAFSSDKNPATCFESKYRYVSSEHVRDEHQNKYTSKNRYSYHKKAFEALPRQEGFPFDQKHYSLHQLMYKETAPDDYQTATNFVRGDVFLTYFALVRCDATGPHDAGLGLRRPAWLVPHHLALPWRWSGSAQRTAPRAPHSSLRRHSSISTSQLLLTRTRARKIYGK